MADVSFLYIAFFLTIGSFFLGFMLSWNLKEVFDTWVAKADYAEVVMHPEMQCEDGPVEPSELIYLRIHNEDDILDDDDE